MNSYQAFVKAAAPTSSSDPLFLVLLLSLRSFCAARSSYSPSSRILLLPIAFSTTPRLRSFCQLFPLRSGLLLFFSSSSLLDAFHRFLTRLEERREKNALKPFIVVRVKARFSLPPRRNSSRPSFRPTYAFLSLVSTRNLHGFVPVAESHSFDRLSLFGCVFRPEGDDESESRCQEKLSRGHLYKTSTQVTHRAALAALLASYFLQTALFMRCVLFDGCSFPLAVLQCCCCLSYRSYATRIASLTESEREKKRVIYLT